MNRRIVALLACVVLAATLQAAPFEEAQVTETVNIVSLLRQLEKPQPATVGDVIKGQTALKTGGDSRAELKFPDLTLTRVGSNSLFRFYAGGRDMTLDGGTMLFYSPKGAGGGKVQAGAITAAVTGSALLIMNVPPHVKIACLQHAAVVSGPDFTVRIHAGQLVDETGKVINIDLAALQSGELFKMGPLPFAISSRRGIIRMLDVQNPNDQALWARRAILNAQQSPSVPNQLVRTSTAPVQLVTTTTTQVTPGPGPAPTPKPHKPHKPHRPHRPGHCKPPPDGGEGGQIRGR